MIFKRKKNNFNFEEVLQDFNFKKYSNKEIFENKISERISISGIYIISFAIVSIFLAFIFFTFKLQFLEYEKYLKKSNNNQFVSVPVLPTRGSILDRNGEVLAKSTKVKNEENGYERVYTDRPGFGHLLGYVKYPQKDSSGVYWQNNFEGVSGLESYYDQLLSGRVGKRLYEKDVSSSLSNTFVVDFPIEGKDVKTSIDADLQEFTYTVLKDFILAKQFQSGSAIIMDIDTGQILAITNYPEYDPKKMIPKIGTTSEFETAERNEYLKNINVNKATPLLNRSIAGTFAPGSTMKPVFALAALQLGLIDPVTSIFSAGYIDVPNTNDPTIKTRFRDWKAHGWVNVRSALAVSSDVFFYAIGGGFETQKGLGIVKIDEWAEAFGVDSLTGIDLGGEVTGNIPGPDWKQKVFKEGWRLGDTYNSSIGQFGFLVTPIGLLRLTAAIATNGSLITPKIRIDENGPTIKKVKENVNPEWYKVVQEGMRMVVTQGTAKNLNTKYFEVAGKSGTAEVGVKKDRIQSWIAGYFPYKKPKYAFVFLCSMGIRNVSPTPNVLARNVFEYMYETKPELFKDVEGLTPVLVEEPVVNEEFSR
jgi:penicillin-binding protein 2